MKESIGGTWLIGIVALFIVLFSAFMAYSINYTKAFRAKNGIIDLIEQNEGYTFYNGSNIDNMTQEPLMNDSSVQAQAYALVKSMGYDYGDSKASGVVCNNDNTISGAGAETKMASAYQPGGYCVYRFCNSDGTYRYKVVTYVMMKFPVINFGITVPIKGETKTLYYEIDNAYNGLCTNK